MTACPLPLAQHPGATSFRVRCLVAEGTLAPQRGRLKTKTPDCTSAARLSVVIDGPVVLRPHLAMRRSSSSGVSLRRGLPVRWVVRYVKQHKQKEPSCLSATRPSANGSWRTRSFASPSRDAHHFFRGESARWRRCAFFVLLTVVLTYFANLSLTTVHDVSTFCQYHLSLYFTVTYTPTLAGLETACSTCSAGRLIVAMTLCVLPSRCG